MLVRAIYKATLRLGRVRLPVKLYAAIEDRRVHFRLLHAADAVPVRQRMVDRDGRPVPPERVRRAYPLDEGALVILDDEELGALEPEASREIAVTRFVPAAAIDDRWYDRPYYLGPDGDPEGYAALSRAIAERGVEGVARWVMRKHAYAGALTVHGGALLLIRLRHAGEIVTANQLPRAPVRAVDAKELALARQLLDTLAAPFDPNAYRDEYQERVRELAEAKARGAKPPKGRAKKRRPAERSLAAALRASLKKVA